MPVMSSGEHRATGPYDRLARVWAQATDGNLWNELLERRLARTLLPARLGGLRVLDAGCAAGAHAAWLAAKGCQVTAIDASPAMIEAAQARHGHSPVQFGVAGFQQAAGIRRPVLRWHPQLPGHAPC